MKACDRLPLALPAVSAIAVLFAFPPTPFALGAQEGQWLALDTGTNGTVTSLLSTASGDLIAGGFFTVAGSTPAGRIARWDGDAWHAMGVLDGAVNALAQLPNGEIVAGGQFVSSEGLPLKRIARWDGVMWQPFGAGLNNTVRAVGVLPNGDLVAGGHFSTAGGVQVNHVASWDGRLWQPMGSGVNAIVLALATLSNGDLVAAGIFTHAGGIPAASIARWDGSEWHALGQGMDGVVSSLAILPGGDLIAGGSFQSAGGIAALRVARWDGEQWHPIGQGIANAGAHVRALAALPNGDLVAGGMIPVILQGNVVAYEHVVRWDGFAWSHLPSGLNDTVSALSVTSKGGLVAGGQFKRAGTRTMNLEVGHVARWCEPHEACSACTAGALHGPGSMTVSGTFCGEGIVSRHFWLSSTTGLSGGSWSVLPGGSFPASWSHALEPAADGLSAKLTLQAPPNQPAAAHAVVVRWSGLCEGAPTTWSKTVVLGLDCTPPQHPKGPSCGATGAPPDWGRAPWALLALALLVLALRVVLGGLPRLRGSRAV